MIQNADLLWDLCRASKIIFWRYSDTDSIREPKRQTVDFLDFLHSGFQSLTYNRLISEENQTGNTTDEITAQVAFISMALREPCSNFTTEKNCCPLAASVHLNGYAHFENIKTYVYIFKKR